MAHLRRSCNFAGQCEPDDEGRFPTQAACSQACYPRPQKEVNYLIQTLNPQTEYLAPSDAMEVMLRLTGVRVPMEAAKRLLARINERDYAALIADDTKLLAWIVRDASRALITRVTVLMYFWDPTWRDGNRTLLYHLQLNQQNVIAPIHVPSYNVTGFTALLGVEGSPDDIGNFYNEYILRKVDFDEVTITTTDGRHVVVSEPTYEDLLLMIAGFPRKNQVIRRLTGMEGDAGLLVHLVNY